MDSVKGSPGPESFYVDEWDENFINEAFQFADRASSNAVANLANPPPVNPSSFHIPEQDAVLSLKPSQMFRSEQRGMLSSDDGLKDVCFSPPRELSQSFQNISEAPPSRGGRVTEENRVRRKDTRVGRENKEVERLKEELKHLSKKFTVMEQECVTLKKDRDKCREQLKRVVIQPEAKDAETDCLKRKNSGASNRNQYSSMIFENTTLATNCVVTHDSKGINLNENGSAVSELKRRVRLDDEATTSCGAQEHFFMESSSSIKHRKTKGIQTDIDQDNTTIIQHKGLLNEQKIVSNLHAVWDLCNKKSGNTLVLKLLKTCSEDLFTLFRCNNMPSNCNLNGLPNESFSEVALDDKAQSIPSNAAAKASRFYQLLLKMCNEIVPVQTVIDVLLDLCNHDNVSVAHVSLRILHATLQHLVLDSRSLRSCVFIDQSNGKSITGSGTIAQETELLKSHAHQITENANEGMPVSSASEYLPIDAVQDSSNTILLPFESVLSIFEMMHKIVLRNLEDYMRLEGLSIMSLIMMESKPNADREKLCSINLLHTLSTIMSREAGVHVRRQAVRLLFLLFNSPKMLLMLYSGQGDGAPSKVDDTQKHTATLQGEINTLLGNIADCLTLSKTDTEELKFRRRVIILLAFVASSGKHGFELLLRPITSQQINLLELIIQLLAFEMDAEIPTTGAIQNFCKDRISLIREALILLNRLTAHPAYSDATLRVLTGTRATTSLTIDVANGLPRRIQLLMKQQHGAKKTQASAEINDLARLFQLRVFSFLGVGFS